MKSFLRGCFALCLLVILLAVPAEAVIFPDVTPGSWYEEAVTKMADEGLLQGYPDGTFSPHDPITAAQYITIATRCAELSPVRGQTTHWAAGSLAAALQAGWYDWDELPPTGEDFDQPITRQLAVKILMKALLPEAKGDYGTQSAKLSDFSDLDGRYYEPVLAAYETGIAVGGDGGAFRPKSGLSRAEACVLFRRALVRLEDQPPLQRDPGLETMSPRSMMAASGGVSENGWLQVVGKQLCNESGEPILLHGMSSHGLQWYGQFVGAQSIQNTADYGANVFRVAMYTGEGGYLSQPETIKQKAFTAVDAAVQSDMYVILDWHILSDGNPITHVAEAEIFFEAAAERYADVPNVLYEICNEPNGNVSWSGDVKPYAERVVSAIRNRSPKSVILIGSPTWSQDIHLAAADPAIGENLMYTFHFYAGTHGWDLRNRVDTAQAAGLPIFVSEWGTSRADGSGGVFLEESKAWLDFLEEKGISWCNWSLCDKNETSAALQPGTSAERTWTADDLSESGKFVFSHF